MVLGEKKKRGYRGGKRMREREAGEEEKWRGGKDR